MHASTKEHELDEGFMASMKQLAGLAGVASTVLAQLSTGLEESQEKGKAQAACNTSSSLLCPAVRRHPLAVKSHDFHLRRAD